jgi:Ser/Thr protein kinase RdoA (MazF antagonist)
VPLAPAASPAGLHGLPTDVFGLPAGALDLPAGLLVSLAQRYELGEPLSCEPVAQGLLNRGYRLVTTHGPYFLKHHLDGRAHTIAQQHRAIARLAARGLPVAPPLPDARGRTVAEAGGHCYALHPWIDGHHRHGSELSLPSSAQLGTLLGRVHAHLQEVMAPFESPEPTLTPAPAEVSADPAQTHALIDDLLASLAAQSRPDSFDALAEHRLLERRGLLRRYAGHRPAPGAAPPSGWVHGDFHPLNLLYASGEPAAIIDWDRLDVRPLAEEAVRGAVLFFLRPDGSLELARVAAYARAYRDASGATRRELAAATYRVWWERLNDFWMLRWRYLLRDRRADPLFPAASALVPWWTNRYGAVLDAFRGVGP